MKQFINDCLLFRSKEKLFVRLGIGTWICLIGIPTLLATMIILIHKHFNG